MGDKATIFFDYALADPVTILATGGAGKIIALYVDRQGHKTYEVEYFNDSKTRCQGWFDAEDLAAVQVQTATPAEAAAA